MKEQDILKQQTIYRIHAWLQMFGERDNETFHKELEKCILSLQYGYDLEEGYPVDSYCWIIRGFKDFKPINRLSVEDLQELLQELLSIQSYY